MFLIFTAWPILGALIGVAAAQRRGFSVAAGVLGGLLLGPLAVLMFFVSGVTRADRNRKCPFCAEFVKAAAVICKHCRRELPPESTFSTGPALVGKTCGNCGRMNDRSEFYCKKCGQLLPAA